MGEMTLSELGTLILAIAAGLVMLANAAEKIGGVWKAIKAPAEKKDTAQNDRIADLEDRMKNLDEWKKGVDRKLDNDQREFSVIHEGLQASFQAQLALLEHGIDGNNIKQMQDAKAVLQQHLISKT